MIYWISYYIIKVVSLLFFPVKTINAEHLPKDKAFIYASNHISNLDPLILGICVQRRISYVAKESLFQNTLLRAFLYSVGAFPIKRNTSDFRAIRETIRRLQMGEPVVYFPEGTRLSKNKRIHSGIGLLAVKSGLPVIPALIKDSDKVLNPGSKILKRHQVTVAFGPPMLFKEGQSYSDIAVQVVNAIHSLS